MRSPGVKQDWVVELRLARLVGQLMYISRYRSNLKDHLSKQIHFDFVFRAEVEFKPKNVFPGIFPGIFSFRETLANHSWRCILWQIQRQL